MQLYNMQLYSKQLYSKQLYSMEQIMKQVNYIKLGLGNWDSKKLNSSN